MADSARRGIVLLSLNYAPEAIGIGPYSAGLAAGLAAAGEPVSVIAGRPYYPDWQPLAGSAAGWRSTRENGVRITRCPHYIPADPTGLRRIFHHLSFAAAALVPCLLAATRRPAVVIVVAPSIFAVPVGWLAARLCGAKLWLHVQDLEVEAAIATGLLNAGRPQVKLARRAVSWLLRRADRVSTISPQMCSRIAWRRVERRRIVELRNWANHPPQGEAGAPGDYRAEWGLGHRKVMLYAGNIANKQGLPLVIEAARLLAGRADIVFVICGQGPNRPALERLAGGLDTIRFHDLQPAGRIAELLALAHAHLLPQLADAADLVLPSKLANMLASGRPVIATAAEKTGLAQEVEGCGIVVPPGDAAALAAAIAELADDPARADALGKAARERAAARWSYGAIIDEWRAGLAECVGDAGDGAPEGLS